MVNTRGGHVKKRAGLPHLSDIGQILQDLDQGQRSRILRSLRNVGITTIEQLCRRTETKLRLEEGIGDKTIEVLSKGLKNIGRTLKPLGPSPYGTLDYIDKSGPCWRAWMDHQGTSTISEPLTLKQLRDAREDHVQKDFDITEIKRVIKKLQKDPKAPKK